MHKRKGNYIKFFVFLLSNFFYFNAESQLPRYKGEAAVNTLVACSGIRHENFRELKTNIVNTIYTNDGRQSLANWMKDRIPNVRGGEYGGNLANILTIRDGGVFRQDTPFFNLLNMVTGNGANAVNINNNNFSKLVNLAFPCWTGTMTCYMHAPEGQSLASCPVIEDCPSGM